MFMANPDASGRLSSSVTSVADAFPVTVLPPILREMVEDVAYVATVPPALPACEALAITSAALGSGLAMPSDRDQSTFGNLYIIAGVESGAGKSVTIKSLMAPVYEYQDQLRTNAQEAHCELKAELFNLAGTLRKVKSDKLCMENDELARLIRRKEYIETELRKWPKIVCEDVTREKLQVLLATNRERMFSASADARQVVQAVLSGKSDNPYLKAWSGDPTDVDRISRDAVPLREPRMTILWCPQPDLLMEMFAKRVLTQNGFLPRVLPCLVDCVPSPISTRTRRVGRNTEDNWRDLVLSLFETYHAKRGQPFILKRTEKAQAVLVNYYNSIIERRHDELADIGPFAARWAEQAWRLAVVLHAGTYGEDAHRQPVKSATAENAKLLMDFFSEQQLDLLQRSRAHAKTEAEQAILDALTARGEITVREMQLGTLRSMSSEGIRRVLDRMVGAGKLVCRVQKAKGGGRDKNYYSRPCDNRDNRDNRWVLPMSAGPRERG